MVFLAFFPLLHPSSDHYKQLLVNAIGRSNNNFIKLHRISCELHEKNFFFLMLLVLGFLVPFLFFHA